MTTSTDQEKNTSKVVARVPMPTPADSEELHDALNATGTKCAVLSLSKYAEDFIPATLQAPLPSPLRSLFREDLMDIPFADLVTKCENLFEAMKVETEEVRLLLKDEFCMF